MAKTTAEELKFPTSDKLKALQLAMDKIEKDHGKGTIIKPPWQYTQLPKLKKPVVLPPLLMQNMLSTVSTLKN